MYGGGLCVNYYGMSAGAFPADVHLGLYIKEMFILFLSGREKKRNQITGQTERGSERCGHKKLSD